jgi:putative membrane protein
MSLHNYSGPRPGRGPGTAGTALTWLLAVAVVGLMIAYPIVGPAHRSGLVIATVVTFFCASVVHAGLMRGWTWAVMLVVIAGGVGGLAEIVGVRTGLPFGDFTYGDVLGVQVLGIPVIVPMGWVMIAYPAYVAARRLTQDQWAFVLVGSWALATWDVFVDPLMVHLGAWQWQHPTPALPGVPGIPLSNVGGWFVVCVVIMALLAALPRRRTHDDQPVALYLWVYASSVIGNALFLDRPSVALVGGIAMGLVAFPLLWRSWEGRG